MQKLARHKSYHKDFEIAQGPNCQNSHHLISFLWTEMAGGGRPLALGGVGDRMA
jgi:hypothetical protein